MQDYWHKLILPQSINNRYHVLVLKKNVHKPGHFQYIIHYEGNHFLVHGHKKDLPHITCIFHLFKYVVNFF